VLNGLLPRRGKIACRLVPRGPSFSIRRRLALSFSTILMLFALNLTVYWVSNAKRKATVEALRRAISSQILIAEINQRLNDTQKQIALLGQAMTDSAAASPDEIATFSAQLSLIKNKINDLRLLSYDAIRGRVDRFAKDYDTLSASWLVFYQNFGVRYATAITELAMRADPMSQRLLQQTVPEILDAERTNVETASARFYSVGAVADRLTGFIFLFSGLVAVVIALRISSHIDRGFSELKAGADRIGSGSFDHSIDIRSHDELGELAAAFNSMSAQLHAAHSNLTRAHEELASRHEEVQRQREVSDSLLRNILPAQIAEELREKDSVEPKYFEDVTILFTDFVQFSNSTRDLPAEDLVFLLHDYFTEFDNIISRYGLEKLKTIGDSYMCVGGLPVRTPSHPVDTVLAAFEILDAVRRRYGRGPSLGVRIGIHTGPVIAGIVGIRKFAFDIWGDSVNLSSRMESSGAKGCINISQQTYSRIKDFFVCESRGQISTKDDLRHEMFFVRGVLPDLMREAERVVPPPAFTRRYGIYFQAKPPAFPNLTVVNDAAGEKRCVVPVAM
jgi:class 3 adenylate cyclase/HAMP domain-containing protein